MFYLDVKYSEKDRANSLGASWDGVAKKWYVPDDIDLEPFREWIPPESLSLAEEIIKSQQPENGIKLSSLLFKVKKAIEDNVQGVYWLNAEIANLQMHNGNLYLQLAETDSKGKEICTSRAIIWKNDLQLIQRKFKEITGNELIKGIKVLLKVKVSYQIKYQMSLIVLDIDPSFTLGGMEAKVKKLRDRIVALNLYDKNKQLTLPDYFRNIAVVSPNDAAGLGDFKADADKLEKHSICKFTYYTATFQGAKTNKTVSESIKKASFDSIKHNYDVIVVIRGGGAKTDLHFLNEFDIAKEIANSKIPVFVGVGHERDRVFIDEISFRSFDTPSKVINFIINNNVLKAKKVNETYNDIINNTNRIFEYINQSINNKLSLIDSNSEKLIIQYKSSISNCFQKINEGSTKSISKYKILLDDSCFKIQLNANNLKTNYLLRIEDKKTLINSLSEKNINNLQLTLDLQYNNIENKTKMILNDHKAELNKIISNIEILSPLNALKNGFAIIKNHDGKIIKSIKELEKEKSFKVQMQDGEKEFKTGE